MRWTWTAALIAALGCTRSNPSAGAGAPDLALGGGTVDLGGGGEDDLARAGGDLATGADLAGAPNTSAKVDLLFLVDNSLSMAPKQTALQARFGALLSALDAGTQGHPLWYHIGVVSSDLGAGPYSTGGCNPGGDGGKLNVTPHSSTAGPPPANCASFGVSGGVRFIDDNEIAGTTNITGGLSVPDAFACIASVGDMGCGFEHQLEATYKVLHDAIPENAGFLRPDAVLVVVYLTDEDDCSASPQTDLFESTMQADGTYGPLASFRCTQWGIACGTPPAQVQPVDSMGPLAGCVPWSSADGGKLFDVQRYIDFFTRPASQGGVKADPRDVILAALAAPATPFSTSVTSTGCPQGFASCPVLDHSCVAASNAQYFGDPAVRLSTVVQAAGSHVMLSICDVDYTPAMQAIAQQILARL